MKYSGKRIICLLITALLFLTSMIESRTMISAAPAGFRLNAGRIKVTVAYNANGGTGAPASHAAAVDGDTATYRLSAVVPKRAGYKFTGWRLDNDRAYDLDRPGQSIAIQVSGSETLTYYAQWEKAAESIRVVIAYHANGGTGAPASHAAAVNGDTAVYRLSATVPVRSGYEFTGWRLDNDEAYDLDRPGQSVAIQVSGSEILTYYAQWKKTAESIRVTIAYHANGGTGAPASHTAAMNGDTAVYRLSATVPVRSGYKFTGWRLDNDNGYDLDRPGQSIAIQVSESGTLTYYAQWEKIAEAENVRVVIGYNANGGTGAPASHEAAVSDGIAQFWLSSEEPEREGYTFKGWLYENKSGGQLLNPGQTVQMDVTGSKTATFYAQWEKAAEAESMRVVVAYNANGGTGAPDSHEAVIRDGIAEFRLSFEKPEREGYTFKGWLYENKSDTYLLNPGQPIKMEATVSKTATFYAQWEKAAEAESIRVVIAYHANGGTGAPDSHEMVTGDGTAQFRLSFEEPERKGYTFKGWLYENESGGQLFSPGQLVQMEVTRNETATFYAQWEPDASYRITYVLNGGTNDRNNPSSYTRNQSVTLNHPARTGYTFGGWYTDNSFRTRVTRIEKGSTGNKTFYAKWTAVSYKITYYLNGGKNASGNPSAYSVTTDRIILKDPVKSGYTFKGWYLESSFRTKVTNIAKGSTGNKSFYARWEKNPVSVNTAATKDKNTSLAKNADAWKKWDQNKAGTALMRKSGCRVTSFAMMVAEAGYASDFNNPTEFYNILKKLKAFTSDGITEAPSYGGMVSLYAEAHGGSATIKLIIEDLKLNEDLTVSERKIMNELKKGKYAVLNLNKRVGEKPRMHTVYVMREKSLSEGVVWIADPGGGANYKYKELKTKYKGRTLKCRTVTLRNLKKR